MLTLHNTTASRLNIFNLQERCILDGTLTVNYDQVDVDYRLKHNDLLANIVHRYLAFSKKQFSLPIQSRDFFNNTNAKCLGKQLLQIITLTNNSLFSTKRSSLPLYKYWTSFILPPVCYFFCKGKKKQWKAFSFLTFYLAFLNKITSQSLDTNFFHEKLG